MCIKIFIKNGGARPKFGLMLSGPMLLISLKSRTNKKKEI